MENNIASAWILKMNHQRLGDILLKDGQISQQQLDFCLKVQGNNGGERLGCVLKHYDFISETHILNALAQQVGWKVYAGDYKINQGIVERLGMDFCLNKLIFPTTVQDMDICVLASTDDMAATDYIQAALDKRVNFYLDSEWRVRKALEQVYNEFHVSQGQKERNEDKDHLIQWFDALLDQACALGATDIHIEPSQKAVEIRMRVDGILRFLDSLRLNQLSKLVNIIFHKADVAISDFNHFHDARYTHIFLNRNVDIRVSHIPSIHGSSIVLRLLDKSKSVIELTALGYAETQWDLIKSNLVEPQGLSLIVGPTGCGKTTTLYAILNYLKSIDRKIVTIEDPVEMHVSLMTQVQMHEKRGISFASAVRAFLRHDPNIILIGEIRDVHTAQEAIRAAMTGHKVFATLHAGRPLDAVLRLNDLGVPFAYLAGNLRMIVTQRLLRTLCPMCKNLYQINKSSLALFEQKYIKNEQAHIFQAVGCDQCKEGYLQRGLVSEVLTFDDELEMYLSEGRMGKLRHCLKNRQGHRTMLEDARQLIETGIIDLKETVRVLG